MKKKLPLSLILAMTSIGFAFAAEPVPGVIVTGPAGKTLYYKLSDKPRVKYIEKEGVQYAALYLNGESTPKYTVPMDDESTMEIVFGEYICVFNLLAPESINLAVGHECTFTLNYSSGEDSYKNLKFNFTLPEGVSLVDGSEALASNIEGFKLSVAPVEGEARKYAAEITATGESTLPAETAGLLSFNLLASGELEGTKIQFTDIVVTNVENEVNDLEGFQVNVNAGELKRGDADLNKRINVNDYNTVKNYILEQKPTPALGSLDYLSADANADNAIDASDCENISYLAYMNAANMAKSMTQATAATSVDGFRATVKGNQLIVSADNATAFMACQMDLSINAADIKSIVTDSKHTVSYNTLSNGMVRVLVTSLANDTFTGSEALTITFDNAPASADIESALFTNIAFQSVMAEAAVTTGISEIKTLNSQLKDGKYLRNGRIIIVKNGSQYYTNGVEIK